jgi:predicted PurR-regulated permease PerM
MNQPPQRVYIDISWRALFKIVIFVIGLFAVFFLRDILVMLFAVFIVVAALNPIIERWQLHMSRGLAVTFLYVILAAIIAFISYLLIPTFFHQLNDLVAALPNIISRAQPLFDSLHTSHYPHLLEQAVNSVSGAASNLSGNILQRTYGLVGSLVTVLTGFVLSFYLLLEERNAKDFFNQILPQNRYDAVYETVSKISDRMGSWVRGQLLLMAIIGVSNLVIYIILGVHAPLALAVWAGLSELIPVAGPVLGVIPPLVVSLTSGNYVQALFVIIFGYFLLQQFEAHFVVPKVMGRAVGLSPVLVIIALLIGIKLMGITGALLAIPTAAVVSVIVGEYPSLRKIWEASSSM